MTMQVKRRMTGASGDPSALKSGQLAYSGVDKRLVIGHGDDGSGNATSIEPVGGSGVDVQITGNQTVAGVKTFSASPLVPTATQGDNSTKAASTAFVAAAMSGAGAGDMLKSTYDSNNDGKVNSADSADAAPWAGITGKPATFPPSAHDASLVTSGVFDIARIPVLPSDVTVVSSNGIADLTAGQQTSIASGTVVTTTDGRRWVYSGSGSKVAEASYIVLADVTPEWSAVANKPTTLAGYGITDAQATDPELSAIAGLTSATDRLPYFTGSGTAALATFTSFGRSLVDDTDAATARSTLGLVIGTNVQAYDSELAALAGLVSAADQLPYFTGSGTASLASFTSYGRSLVAAADAPSARTVLGLGSMALQPSTGVSITGGSISSAVVIDDGTF